MLELITMVQLGALAGAISVTHGFATSLNSAGDEVDDATAWIVSFLIAPLMGGIWGAVVGAAIYFAVGLVASFL